MTVTKKPVMTLAQAQDAGFDIIVVINRCGSCHARLVGGADVGVLQSRKITKLGLRIAISEAPLDDA